MCDMRSWKKNRPLTMGKLTSNIFSFFVSKLTRFFPLFMRLKTDNVRCACDSWNFSIFRWWKVIEINGNFLFLSLFHRTHFLLRICYFFSLSSSEIYDDRQFRFCFSCTKFTLFQFIFCLSSAFDFLYIFLSHQFSC